MLLTLFAMLWLPLGQYVYLVENWMKIGTYAAPFLVFGTVAFRDSVRSPQLLMDFRAFSVGLFVAYIAHQYEEHWIDLFGNHYAFLENVNQMFAHTTSCAGITNCPLTPEAIFVINTSLVWLVGFIAIWRAPEHLFPALAMSAIVIVNAFTHIVAGVVRWAYNPGLLTSVLIFIPVSITFFFQVLQYNRGYKRQIIGSLIWAILAHVVMVGGLLLANLFRLIPESLYFTALVVWSCLPLFMFREE